MARDLHLDLGSVHTAYRHASLVDLYLPTYQISLKLKKLFMDGRMYGRTSENHFIRSTRSRPKNYPLASSFPDPQMDSCCKGHDTLHIGSLMHCYQGSIPPMSKSFGKGTWQKLHCCVKNTGMPMQSKGHCTSVKDSLLNSK